MDALSLFMILASSIPTGQLIAVIALAAACVAFGVTDIVLFATRNKAKDESLAGRQAFLYGCGIGFHDVCLKYKRAKWILTKQKMSKD